MLGPEHSVVAPEQLEEPKVTPIDGGFEVYIPDVKLDSETDAVVKIKVEMEKIPISDIEGKTIGPNNGLVVDIETSNIEKLHGMSEKIQGMIESARSLRKVKDTEKPRKIMELVRANVAYAYDEVIQNLEKSDSDSASWVRENAGMHGGKTVNASEIVDRGFGVCRHLAALATILAKEAGAEVSFETSVGSEGFVNVRRRDDGQRLFKSYEEGRSFGTAHAWVEFKMSDGSWVPMDPSTKLVGDNEDEMQIFNDANYRGSIASLDVSNLPPGVKFKSEDQHFLPGEAQHSAIMNITCGRTISLSSGSSIPRSYSGPLTFQITSLPTTDGINVKIKTVEFVQ